jgi:hypothetical protein
MEELVDDNVVRRQPPRELSLIFDELRSLMEVEGALHEISTIVYRDWLLVIDTKEARVVDPPEQRWSSTKLNNNELLLLLGLMVQSVDDRIYSVFMTSNEFAKSMFGNWAGPGFRCRCEYDSHFGCGHASSEAEWPRSPGRPSATHLT